MAQAKLMKWYKTSRKSSVLVCLRNNMNSVALHDLVCPTDCFGKALSLIWLCVDTVVVCFRLDFAMPGFLSGVSGLAWPTFTSQWIYSLCTVRCHMGKSSFCTETAAQFLGSLWGWIQHWAVTASVTHYYSGLLPSLEALLFPLLVWGMVRSTVWV